MLKWLQLRHQSLLDGMQNVVPIILDYLVDKGKIDPLRSDVYQEIMLDTTTPLQKARKLLDWLSTRPPDVFWAFQHAIRQDRVQTDAVHRLAVSEEEMRELVERVKNMSLPETLDLMNCGGVLKAREELGKTYRSRDQLLMSAGLAKGKTMAMEKILVNVCLLSSEEVKKAFEKPSFSSHQDWERCEYLFSKILQSQPSLLNLEDLFKAKQEGEDDPHKVMASGGAGCGKSVCFTRKAPYDWAIGKLWQQFALLFCLELRDKSVWQAKTLAELLKLDRLSLNAKEQEEVVHFITSHPDQVVIICDGLDEGSVDESSLLWSLLQGNCVGIPSRLRVVVTTRPCNAVGDILQSTSYRGVEVVGFTREDIAVFARNYLGEETSKKLLSLLDKQPSIAGLMHAPLFSLLVCDLFQEKQDLPSRKTEIFEKIVVALLHRYSKAHFLKEKFNNFADTPASMRKLVIGLGKVAFQGLLKKQLYFTDVDLKKAGMPAEALELGLLMKSESTVFWEPDEFAFSHLTLQEFLAAVYVSSEALQTAANVAKLLEEIRFDDGHLTTFWVFLAGLLDSTMCEVLLDHAASGILEVAGTFWGTWTLLWPQPVLQVYRCYAESLSAHSGTPSASIGKILKMGTVNFFKTNLSVADCAAIGTVLQSHNQTEHVQSVHFCDMNDAGLAQLLPGLLCCKSMLRLAFEGNQLSSQHMLAVSDILANSATTLETMNLGFNMIGDDGLEKLSEGLKRCRKMKMLRLSRNHLSSKSASILSNVLRSLQSLEELSIGRNNLGDIGIEQLANGLQLCSRLVQLNIYRTAMSSKSIPVLLHLLSSLPSLRLVVGRNDFSKEGRKRLVCVLSSDGGKRVSFW